MVLKRREHIQDRVGEREQVRQMTGLCVDQYSRTQLKAL